MARHILARREFMQQAAAGLPSTGLAASPFGSAKTKPAPVTAGELEQMRVLATAYMGRWSVPGLQVAIARQDGLVYNQAFGVADSTTGSALTVNNLFRIASLSKPITSVAIYKLIEAKKLSLTSKVIGAGAVLGTRYGRQPYSARLKSITVQHLLTHTAGGWANDAYDPMFSNVSLSIQDLISWTLNNRPLVNDPGTSYAYSNFGYAILGRVIEQVSGKDYPAYVSSAVLQPCGITTMKIAGNTLADRLTGEVLREHGHGRGGRLRQGEGEGLIGAGPAGGEEVEALEPPVGQPWRAHAALVPAMASPPFLTNAGFILAPELDLRSRMRLGDRGELRAKHLC